MANESKPFEWLSGGLFFGKGKDGIDSVDSCKDVLTLLKGIDENLAGTIAEANGVSIPPSTTEDANENNTTESQFLASRLSRLRFLLYDERRASSQDSRRSTSVVAYSTMEGLTGDKLGHLVPKLIKSLHLLPQRHIEYN